MQSMYVPVLRAAGSGRTTGPVPRGERLGGGPGETAGAVVVSPLAAPDAAIRPMRQEALSLNAKDQQIKERVAKKIVAALAGDAVVGLIKLDGKEVLLISVPEENLLGAKRVEGEAARLPRGAAGRIKVGDQEYYFAAVSAEMRSSFDGRALPQLAKAVMIHELEEARAMIQADAAGTKVDETVAHRRAQKVTANRMVNWRQTAQQFSPATVLERAAKKLEGSAAQVNRAAIRQAAQAGQIQIETATMAFNMGNLPNPNSNAWVGKEQTLANAYNETVSSCYLTAAHLKGGTLENIRVKDRFALVRKLQLGCGLFIKTMGEGIEWKAAWLGRALSGIGLRLEMAAVSHGLGLTASSGLGAEFEKVIMKRCNFSALRRIAGLKDCELDEHCRFRGIDFRQGGDLRGLKFEFEPGTAMTVTEYRRHRKNAPAAAERRIKAVVKKIFKGAKYGDQENTLIDKDLRKVLDSVSREIEDHHRVVNVIGSFKQFESEIRKEHSGGLDRALNSTPNVLTLTCRGQTLKLEKRRIDGVDRVQVSCSGAWKTADDDDMKKYFAAEGKINWRSGVVLSLDQGVVGVLRYWRERS